MNNFSEVQLKKWCTPQYVTSFDGEKLYTECYQKTPNPTTTHIILHGLGGNSQSSLLLVNEILTRFPNHQVITYDARGHGYSSKRFPLRKYSQIDQFGTADLNSIIRKYRPQQLNLWGHSLGSFIIQSYLQQDEHQACFQVFLLNSSLQTSGSMIPRQFFFSLLLMLDQFQRSSASNQASFSIGLKFAKTPDISLKRVLLQDMLNTSFWSYPLLFLSIKGWKNNKLKSVDQSNVFFVGGKRDILIPYKNQLKQKEQIQQARTFFFDCNHHQIFFTHFKELVDLLTQKNKLLP